MTRRVTPVATLTFEYDAAERPLKVIDSAQGLLKEFSFGTNNSTNPVNGITNYALGKLISATRHHPATALGSLKVKEVYLYEAPGGRLSSKTTTIEGDPLGTKSFADSYQYDTMGLLKDLTYPTCSGCAAGAPARTVMSLYQHGLPVEIVGYTSGNIQYHPNGMVALLQHANPDAVAGPIDSQTLLNDMARPGTLEVTRYCDNLAVTNPPAEMTVNSGQTFQVAVSATGATGYQWFRGETAIADQTTSTLTASADSQTLFWVRVSNGMCSVDSTPVTVNVNQCSPPSVAITAPASMPAGQTATASVAAIPNASYTWTVQQGTIVSGANTNEITFRAACSGTAVALSVRVTNACGTYADAARNVSINRGTVVVTGSRNIAPGQTAEIVATLAGAAPWVVQWSDGVSSSQTSELTVRRNVSPSANTTFTATATDNYGCAMSASGQAAITVVAIAPPAALLATAVNPSRVDLTWYYPETASEFGIYRNGVRTATAPGISTPGNTGYTDASVQSGNAYYYEVRAARSGVDGLLSSRDLATTIFFTDDPFVPIAEGGTKIRLIHFTQLQTAILAVSSLTTLAQPSFSVLALNDTVLPGHVNQLWQALNAARLNLGLPALSGGNVASKQRIATVDIKNLRDGVT